MWTPPLLPPLPLPRTSCLVASDAISDAKARFSLVSSVHAYGAVPSLTPDTNALLYAADVSVLAKDMLVAESPAAQLYRRNRGSGIRCPEVNNRRLREGAACCTAITTLPPLGCLMKVQILPPGKSARPLAVSKPAPSAASSAPKTASAIGSTSSGSSKPHILKPTSATAFFGKGKSTRAHKVGR